MTEQKHAERRKGFEGAAEYLMRQAVDLFQGGNDDEAKYLRRLANELIETARINHELSKPIKVEEE